MYTVTDFPTGALPIGVKFCTAVNHAATSRARLLPLWGG